MLLAGQQAMEGKSTRSYQKSMQQPRHELHENCTRAIRAIHRPSRRHHRGPRRQARMTSRRKHGNGSDRPCTSYADLLKRLTGWLYVLLLDRHQTFEVNEKAVTAALERFSMSQQLRNIILSTCSKQHVRVSTGGNAASEERQSLAYTKDTRCRHALLVHRL